MFGEKTLIGQCEAKVDPKGRIIIPKWTQREKGDHLVCLEDEKLGVYRIYNKENIVKKILQFEKIKQNCKTVKKLEEIKKLELKFYKSIITEATLDNQGRFLIGDKLNVRDIKFIGAGTNLILELKK